jgi:SAM-dependent methyltransferase
MGVKLNRQKKRNWPLSIIYKLSKWPLLSDKAKFKLFLNLEWIFERLAHEKSFDYYSVENHPLRIYSTNYILNRIKETDTVLDLGCHAGQITSVIASKAKRVVGIDYDKEAIEQATRNQKRENLSFVNDDVKKYLSTNTVSFDILILSHILEHLDSPKQIILDCKPYVKYMYIELPDFDKSYLNHYRKDLGCDLIYSDTDHVNEFDRMEIKDLVKECGFELIESEYRFGVQRHWCINKE